MLEAGEDPLYIARRIIRMASEDIGLADPSALVQAVNAFQAYHFLGSPEGDLALAQAVVYLCLAPKSNSLYVALDHALDSAKNTGAARVPLHLRNAPTGLMKKLGYGREYKYAHDFEGGWLPELYTPVELGGLLFYEPKAAGWEGRFKDQLEQRRAMVKKLMDKESGSGS
jgi:putative ATPase